MLLPYQDYLTIRAYVGFMNMLAEEIKGGKSVEELFDPSKIERKYLPGFSILVVDNERQLRSIGNRKEKLGCLLDKSLFEEDAESEAAIECENCCMQVEIHAKKARNQREKALDGERDISARLKAAEKCVARAKKAVELASGAQRSALASKGAAERLSSSSASEEVKSVRPHNKAEYDAEEARGLASSAAEWAAGADAAVLQADLFERRSWTRPPRGPPPSKVRPAASCCRPPSKRSRRTRTRSARRRETRRRTAPAGDGRRSSP